MRTNPLKIVAIWSVASFAVTTAMLLPASLQADNPAQNASAVAMPASVSTDRFELSITLPDLKSQRTNPMLSVNVDEGPAPKMLLVAKNKTGAALTVPVKIQMSESSRASRLSRVPSMPREIWHDEREITLQPGATQKIELISDATLSANTSVSVAMTAGDHTVLTTRLAVRAGTATAMR